MRVRYAQRVTENSIKVLGSERWDRLGPSQRHPGRIGLVDVVARVGVDEGKGAPAKAAGRW